MRIENPRVRGSIPRLATKDLKTPALTGWRFAFWLRYAPKGRLEFGGLLSSGCLASFVLISRPPLQFSQLDLMSCRYFVGV